MKYNCIPLLSIFPLANAAMPLEQILHPVGMGSPRGFFQVSVFHVRVPGFRFFGDVLPLPLSAYSDPFCWHMCEWTKIGGWRSRRVIGYWQSGCCWLKPPSHHHPSPIPAYWFWCFQRALVLANGAANRLCLCMAVVSPYLDEICLPAKFNPSPKIHGGILIGLICP